MKLKVKTFKTMHPVPGFGIGTYWVGKNNISEIKAIAEGLLVFRERGGMETNPPCVFTWANIMWYEGDAEEEPKRPAAKKKVDD